MIGSALQTLINEILPLRLPATSAKIITLFCPAQVKVGVKTQDSLLSKKIVKI